MGADWADYCLWWQVFPLGFLGAEAEAIDAPPTHRLQRLEGWLDHLVGLGCNGLALGPVFASQSHGYDTVDHFRVDPRLGTEDDLVRLFQACRERGIRVLLDGVFNHVGTGHPAFTAVVEQGPQAATADWFRLTWPPDWRPGTRPGYADFEGHSRLVALNHDSAEVVELVASVMNHWLDRGADGWRLDAAYAVPPGFWARVLPAVRQRHPQAWIVGEVIHGDYPAIVAESGLDSVTEYELWKATWSSISDVNFFELDWTMSRHNALLDAFVPMTFLGNHDVTRIASRIADARNLPHAVVVLATVGGVPSIYYGDEYAERAVKEGRLGGDDAIRPEFGARPGEPEGEAKYIYSLYRELFGLRRRLPWLVRARTSTLHLANASYVYTSAADGQSIVVAMAIGDQPVEVPGGGGRQLLAGHAEVRGDRLLVPGHGWAVLAP